MAEGNVVEEKTAQTEKISQTSVEVPVEVKIETPVKNFNPFLDSALMVQKVEETENADPSTQIVPNAIEEMATAVNIEKTEGWEVFIQEAAKEIVKEKREKFPKVFSEGAYALLEEARFVPLLEVREYFAKKISAGMLINAEDAQRFINIWIDKYGIPENYIFTPEGYRIWQSYGGEKIATTKELQQKVGKRYGIGREIIPLLEQKKKEAINFEFDGDKEPCYVCNRVIQPDIRNKMRDGKPSKNKEGKIIKIGNFRSVSITKEDKLKLIRICICHPCRNNNEKLRGLPTFPRAEVDEYIKRQEDKENAVSRIVESGTRRLAKQWGAKYKGQ